MGEGGTSMFYLAVILIALYLVGAGAYTLFARIRKRVRSRREDG